jgi:3D (Asp-Asp-Asp) domain-containing protein
MVGYGICAVDPTVIPLGTRFYVPGYGTCLAADTGGLVKGMTVDLGFPEEAGNNPWATQTLDIYILD